MFTTLSNGGAKPLGASVSLMESGSTMRMKPCRSSQMTWQMTRLFAERPSPHTKPSYLREENKNAHHSVFGTRRFRFPVYCRTGLAVLLASPCYRHRIHWLFRHRVLVEAGAGHLAHCCNPALHFPPQQVKFIIDIMAILKQGGMYYGIETSVSDGFQ
jgi:hypothetical protein